MTVRFHPRAREDLLEAAKYYREHAGVELAQAFAGAFADARVLIEEAPERWSVRAHGTRLVNLKRFPYYVAYLVEVEEIWIVAVAHAARRPFFWKGRLEDR